MARKNNFLSTLLSTFFVVLAVMGVASLFTRSAPSSKDCEHEWDEGTVKVEATCSSPGSLVYECELCGETKKSEIPMVEHLDADKDLMCDFCSVELYQKITSGATLDFGTYRVFRTSETQMFEGSFFTFCNNETELDGEIMHQYEVALLEINIPALSSGNDINVFNKDLSKQDIITAYVYDDYVDFVFKDGSGSFINSYGDHCNCHVRVDAAYYSLMDPVGFYKVLF